MTPSENKMSIRHLTYGNPPGMPNPARVGDKVMQYHLMWVKCYEYPTGNVFNPGKDWMASLLEGMAAIWRWKQRDERLVGESLLKGS